MKFEVLNEGQTAEKKKGNPVPLWLKLLLWSVTFGSIFFMGVVIQQRTPFIRSIPGTDNNNANLVGEQLAANVDADKTLPEHLTAFIKPTEITVPRSNPLNTKSAGNTRRSAEEYIIQAGDSLYGIASEFDLEPETLLWSNYNTLRDDAHNISPGDELIIPPVDGILYEWKENDILQRVAEKHRVTANVILESPVNNLDITNPKISAGDRIMIPGGWRETVAISPVVFEFSTNAGAKKVISGPGGCSYDYRQTGGGGFIWPAPGRSVSGNEFWSGHLALDVACVQGAPIYASDSGTAIYSGTISGGYGIMVMIDHGNGYQTLYAHLSATSSSCGQGVSQGQVIGYCGSTGNSTGAHLHFEVRFMGGYVNPWTVL